MDMELWSAYDHRGDGHRQHAGCGQGLYASALLAAGAEVVGVDPSPAMAGER